MRAQLEANIHGVVKAYRFSATFTALQGPAASLAAEYFNEFVGHAMLKPTYAGLLERLDRHFLRYEDPFDLRNQLYDMKGSRDNIRAYTITFCQLAYRIPMREDERVYTFINSPQDPDFKTE